MGGANETERGREAERHTGGLAAKHAILHLRQPEPLYPKRARKQLLDAMANYTNNELG